MNDDKDINNIVERFGISGTMPLNAEVFIEEEVIKTIVQFECKYPYKEWGMFLIGSICKDPITNKPIAYVYAVYYEEKFGTHSSFVFDIDYTMNCVKAVKREFIGFHIIGNAHSHGQHPAYWSHVDEEMMRQSRDNSLYLVISPKYGTYKAILKDDEFNFYDCNIHVVKSNQTDELFSKTAMQKENNIIIDDKGIKCQSFRKEPHYTDVQKEEFTKRFLHSIEDIQNKKVLIVGAGTIGNLLVQNAINCGVGNISIVDIDTYEYMNRPRSCMIDETSLRKPKAIELARVAAEHSSFPIEVTGINTDICNLGWGFFKQFDLVISPVDSMSIRQYIDRGCKLYKIPHITCGTNVLEETNEFTGNVISFPADAVVDLEYIWGTGYRSKLEERRSCSDYKEEVQAQVISFSAQIAGMTWGLAMKYLQGKMEDNSTVWKYVLNEIGNGYEHDKVALRTYKYGYMPENAASELYEVFDPKKEIYKLTFNRNRPKRELWDELREVFQDDSFSYNLDLEWSLNIPVAYANTGACANIEVHSACGIDPIIKKLPKQHVYLVKGEEKELLIEITFVDKDEMDF